MERADLAGKEMLVVVGWKEDAGRCWMERICRSLLDGKKMPVVVGWKGDAGRCWMEKRSRKKEWGDGKT